jgi:AcrR family transcriptional regulator
MIKDCEGKIIRQMIKICAEKGLDNLSTLQLAKRCNLSEATIFKHFGTKDNLYLQAFLSIDKEISKTISECAVTETDLRGSVYNMWRTYFGFLLANRDKTRYYREFRGSHRYRGNTHFEQDKYYVSFLQTIAPIAGQALAAFDYGTLWTFIIENSLMFAENIANGKIKGDEDNIKIIFSLVFGTVFSALGM